MFVLIGATLLVLAGAGGSDMLKEFCQNCVSLPAVTITAEVGLCVVVPCFLHADYEGKSVTWEKCGEKNDEIIYSSNNNINIQPKFKGRVSPLDTENNKNCSIVISNITNTDAGSYQLYILPKYISAKLPKVNITVTDRTQNLTLTIPRLTEGQNATLTCTAPPHCSGSEPRIRWRWSRAEPQQGAVDPRNVTGSKTEELTPVTRRLSSTLTFTVSRGHENTNVSCEVQFSDGSTQEETKTLSVLKPPTISNSSSCRLQSDVLTCECISEGHLVPGITWPDLANTAEYLEVRAVSNHMVRSTVTVRGKHLANESLLCQSGNVTQRLEIVTNTAQKEDQLTQLLNMITQLVVIIAFLIGILLGIILTSIITCLARKCQRRKQKSHNITDNLEMVNTQAVSRINAGESAEDVETHEGPEGGAEGGGPSAPSGDERAMEGGYSDINFSMLNRKDPGEAAVTPITESEYAEIKTETAGGGGPGEEEKEGEDETLEGSREKEVMVGQDEGVCRPAEEEGGEEAALYSNVKEMMAAV